MSSSLIAASGIDCSHPGGHGFHAGKLIYSGGTPGTPWIVVEGSVRLDCKADNSESHLANLAVRGDIIGGETLLLDQYSFTATALSDCILTHWTEGPADARDLSLIRAICKSQTRMSEVIALRCGPAASRVEGLLRLLAGRKSGCQEPADFTLPTLRDMADITALNVETVSRVISSFSRDGMLVFTRQRRGRAATKTATFIGTRHPANA